MALKAKDIVLIEDAIKRGSAISFEYSPNKYPKGSFPGKRVVIPLALFRKNGNFYFFAYWISGVSASGGGLGYRLYFQRNMTGVEIVNVGFNFNATHAHNKRWFDIIWRKRLED